MNTELQVTIQTQSGALTVTPLSLLQYYLPGARPLPDNPQIYEAAKPGKPNDKQYVWVETMHGVLMTARDKHLNPISEIYVIPSNSPQKKSGYKIKYDAALERLRHIPGYLGLLWGVLVERDKQIVRRDGEACYPGDTLYGAWAECYISGMPKPIAHEVSLSEAKGTGPNWDNRPAFMVCKVCIDHLATKKVFPVYASGTAPEEEGVLLEAHVPEVVPPQDHGRRPSPEPSRPIPLTAGTEYVGVFLRARVPQGQKSGAVEVQVGEEKVVCFFWQVPPALDVQQAELDRWQGRTAAFSFTEKKGQDGRIYRTIATFVFAAEDETDDLPASFDENGTPIEPNGGAA